VQTSLSHALLPKIGTRASVAILLKF